MAIDFLEFDVPARLRECIGLMEEFWPVLDAANHVASVDVVEGIAFVSPVGFCIVDFKAEVWRDPSEFWLAIVVYIKGRGLDTSWVEWG